MGQQMRFVVMGDMHYVQPECHQRALGGNPRGVTELGDITRNYWMTQNVLPEIISNIQEQKPDFIFQTGDFIQGHCDNEEACMREMEEGLKLLQALHIPVFLAMGTHDGVPGKLGGGCVEKLVYPAISNALGEPITERYYKFVKQNSLFVVLDYTTFTKDSEQASFIDETLRNAREYDHVFIFAHPPLILLGRPFFTNYEFTEYVTETVGRYSVDAYFCGHTHNQVASIHKLGEKWIPQLQSSILAYPDQEAIPYAEVRPFIPNPSTFELGWAYLEDSAPSWWLVTVDGSKVTAEWNVLHKGVQGVLTWNSGEKPSFIRMPDLKPKNAPRFTEGMNIKSARIRMAGINFIPSEAYKVYVNDSFVGQLPRLEYFDCRQFLPIDSEIIPFIKERNIIKVTTSEEKICLGAFVLEVETEYGRIRSNVSQFYTNVSKWGLWEVDRLAHIEPFEAIEASLYFNV